MGVSVLGWVLSAESVEVFSNADSGTIMRARAEEDIESLRACVSALRAYIQDVTRTCRRSIIVELQFACVRVCFRVRT